ncbi:unnamed protein product [Amoebophrya sp. A25]|nr:unnamed protein product [Amoebophrya sp. A25]|eukprot:GSA25T00003579001.1
MYRPSFTRPRRGSSPATSVKLKAAALRRASSPHRLPSSAGRKSGINMYKQFHHGLPPRSSSPGSRPLRSSLMSQLPSDAHSEGEEQDHETFARLEGHVKLRKRHDALLDKHEEAEKSRQVLADKVALLERDYADLHDRHSKLQILTAAHARPNDASPTLGIQRAKNLLSKDSAGSRSSKATNLREERRRSSSGSSRSRKSKSPGSRSSAGGLSGRRSPRNELQLLRDLSATRNEFSSHKMEHAALQARHSQLVDQHRKLLGTVQKAEKDSKALESEVAKAKKQVAAERNLRISLNKQVEYLAATGAMSKKSHVKTQDATSAIVNSLRDQVDRMDRDEAPQPAPKVKDLEQIVAALPLPELKGKLEVYLHDMRMQFRDQFVALYKDKNAEIEALKKRIQGHETIHEEMAKDHAEKIEDVAASTRRNSRREFSKKHDEMAQEIENLKKKKAEDKELMKTEQKLLQQQVDALLLEVADAGRAHEEQVQARIAMENTLRSMFGQLEKKQDELLSMTFDEYSDGDVGGSPTEEQLLEEKRLNRRSRASAIFFKKRPSTKSTAPFQEVPGGSEDIKATNYKGEGEATLPPVVDGEDEATAEAEDKEKDDTKNRSSSRKSKAPLVIGGDGRDVPNKDAAPATTGKDQDQENKKNKRKSTTTKNKNNDNDTVLGVDGLGLAEASVKKKKRQVDSVSERLRAWEGMQKDLDEKTARITAMEQEYIATMDDLRHQQEFLSQKLQEQSASLLPQISKLQEELAFKTERVTFLEHELEHVEKLHEIAVAEDAEKKLQALEQDKLRQEMKALQMQLDAAHKDLEEQTEAKAGQEVQHAALDGKIANLEAQKQRLLETVRLRDQEIAKIKALVDEVHPVIAQAAAAVVGASASSVGGGAAPEANALLEGLFLGPLSGSDQNAHDEHAQHPDDPHSSAQPRGGGNLRARAAMFERQNNPASSSIPAFLRHKSTTHGKGGKAGGDAAAAGGGDHQHADRPSSTASLSPGDGDRQSHSPALDEKESAKEAARQSLSQVIAQRKREREERDKHVEEMKVREEELKKRDEEIAAHKKELADARKAHIEEKEFLQKRLDEAAVGMVPPEWKKAVARQTIVKQKVSSEGGYAEFHSRKEMLEKKDAGRESDDEELGNSTDQSFVEGGDGAPSQQLHVHHDEHLHDLVAQRLYDREHQSYSTTKVGGKQGATSTTGSHNDHEHAHTRVPPDDLEQLHRHHLSDGHGHLQLHPPQHKGGKVHSKHFKGPHGQHDSIHQFILSSGTGGAHMNTKGGIMSAVSSSSQHQKSAVDQMRGGDRDFIHGKNAKGRTHASAPRRALHPSRDGFTILKHDGDDFDDVDDASEDQDERPKHDHSPSAAEQSIRMLEADKPGSGPPLQIHHVSGEKGKGKISKGVGTSIGKQDTHQHPQRHEQHHVGPPLSHPSKNRDGDHHDGQEQPPSGASTREDDHQHHVNAGEPLLSVENFMLPAMPSSSSLRTDAHVHETLHDFHRAAVAREAEEDALKHARRHHVVDLEENIEDDEEQYREEQEEAAILQIDRTSTKGGTTTGIGRTGDQNTPRIMKGKGTKGQRARAFVVEGEAASPEDEVVEGGEEEAGFVDGEEEERVGREETGGSSSKKSYEQGISSTTKIENNDRTSRQQDPEQREKTHTIATTSRPPPSNIPPRRSHSPPSPDTRPRPILQMGTTTSSAMKGREGLSGRTTGGKVGKPQLQPQQVGSKGKPPRPKSAPSSATDDVLHSLMSTGGTKGGASSSKSNLRGQRGSASASDDMGGRTRSDSRQQANTTSKGGTSARLRRYPSESDHNYMNTTSTTSDDRTQRQSDNLKEGSRHTQTSTTPSRRSSGILSENNSLLSRSPSGGRRGAGRGPSATQKGLSSAPKKGSSSAAYSSPSPSGGDIVDKPSTGAQKRPQTSSATPGGGVGVISQSALNSVLEPLIGASKVEGAKKGNKRESSSPDDAHAGANNNMSSTSLEAPAQEDNDSDTVAPTHQKGNPKGKKGAKAPSSSASTTAPQPQPQPQQAQPPPPPPPSRSSQDTTPAPVPVSPPPKLKVSGSRNSFFLSDRGAERFLKMQTLLRWKVVHENLKRDRKMRSGRGVHVIDEDSDNVDRTEEQQELETTSTSRAIAAAAAGGAFLERSMIATSVVVPDGQHNVEDIVAAGSVSGRSHLRHELSQRNNSGEGEAIEEQQPPVLEGGGEDSAVVDVVAQDVGQDQEQVLPTADASAKPDVSSLLQKFGAKSGTSSKSSKEDGKAKTSVVSLKTGGTTGSKTSSKTEKDRGITTAISEKSPQVQVKTAHVEATTTTTSTTSPPLPSASEEQASTTGSRNKRRSSVAVELGHHVPHHKSRRASHIDALHAHMHERERAHDDKQKQREEWEQEHQEKYRKVRGGGPLQEVDATNDSNGAGRREGTKGTDTSRGTIGTSFGGKRAVGDDDNDDDGALELSSTSSSDDLFFGAAKPKAKLKENKTSDRYTELKARVSAHIEDTREKHGYTPPSSRVSLFGKKETSEREENQGASGSSKPSLAEDPGLPSTTTPIDHEQAELEAQAPASNSTMQLPAPKEGPSSSSASATRRPSSILKTGASSGSRSAPNKQNGSPNNPVVPLRSSPLTRQNVKNLDASYDAKTTVGGVGASSSSPSALEKLTEFHQEQKRTPAPRPTITSSGTRASPNPVKGVSFLVETPVNALGQPLTSEERIEQKMDALIASQFDRNSSKKKKRDREDVLADDDKNNVEDILGITKKKKKKKKSSSSSRSGTSRSTSRSRTNDEDEEQDEDEGAEEDDVVDEDDGIDDDVVDEDDGRGQRMSNDEERKKKSINILDESSSKYTTSHNRQEKQSHTKQNEGSSPLSVSDFIDGNSPVPPDGNKNLLYYSELVLNRSINQAMGMANAKEQDEMFSDHFLVDDDEDSDCLHGREATSRVRSPKGKNNARTAGSQASVSPSRTTAANLLYKINPPYTTTTSTTARSSSGARASTGFTRSPSNYMANTITNCVVQGPRGPTTSASSAKTKCATPTSTSSPLRRRRPSENQAVEQQTVSSPLLRRPLSSGKKQRNSFLDILSSPLKEEEAVKRKSPVRGGRKRTVGPPPIM